MLREGINYHWVGARHYVGRGHAGGAVMTGPMSQQEALNLSSKYIADGHQAAIAEETATRAAWFSIACQLD